LCTINERMIKMNLKTASMITLAALIPFVSLGKSKYKAITFGDTTLEPDESIVFSLDDAPDSIAGYDVLSEYLPDGIEVTWTGKKFTAPKAGKVKYSKSEEGFVTTNDDNPCGFKVSINKKNGKVKGSFKVYVEKSEKKVKAYSASFSGKLGGEITVKIKKVGTYSATLE